MTAVTRAVLVVEALKLPVGDERRRVRAGGVIQRRR